MLKNSQKFECRVAGAVPIKLIDSFFEVLSGLSGFKGEQYEQHEVVFGTHSNQNLELKIQRQIVKGLTDELAWKARLDTRLFRGGIKDLPVGVFSVCNAAVIGSDVLSFWRALKLNQIRENLKRGKTFRILLDDTLLQVNVVKVMKLLKDGDIQSAVSINDNLLLIDVFCESEAPFEQAVSSIGVYAFLLRRTVHVNKDYNLGKFKELVKHYAILKKV